ncbi:MAG: hypothetical protein Kow0025_16150 [Thermodesulfovibrionales bacterium]
MENHRHDYEPVFHPSLTQEARELGLKGAEIRKCKTCGKEMPFVWIREDWVPLFEETERSEKDILLA